MPCTAVRVGDCISVGERARSNPHDAADPGRRIHRLGQPEVEDFDFPFYGSFYVLRLEVSMNDPLLVRLFERLRDLPSDGKALIEG